MSTYDQNVNGEDQGVSDVTMNDLNANTKGQAQRAVPASGTVPTTTEDPVMRDGSREEVMEGRVSPRPDLPVDNQSISIAESDDWSGHWPSADDIEPDEDPNLGGQERPPRRKSRPPWRPRRPYSRSRESRGAARLPRLKNKSAEHLDRDSSQDRDWSPPRPHDQPPAASSSRRPIGTHDGSVAHNPFSPYPGSGYYDRESHLGSDMAFLPRPKYAQYGAGPYSHPLPGLERQAASVPVYPDPNAPLNSSSSRASTRAGPYDRDTPSFVYMLPSPESRTQKSEPANIRGGPKPAVGVVKAAVRSRPVPVSEQVILPPGANGPVSHQPLFEGRAIEDAVEKGHLPARSAVYATPEQNQPMTQITPGQVSSSGAYAPPPPMPQALDQIHPYMAPSLVPLSDDPAYISRLVDDGRPPPSGPYGSYGMPPLPGYPLYGSPPPGYPPYGMLQPPLPPPPSPRPLVPANDSPGDPLEFVLGDPPAALPGADDDLWAAFEIPDARSKKRSMAKRKGKKLESEKALAPTFRGYTLELGDDVHGHRALWDKAAKLILPYGDAKLDAMIKWNRSNSKDDPAKALSQLMPAQRHAVNAVVAQEQAAEKTKTSRWVLADLQRFGKQRFGKLVETRKIQIILERQIHAYGDSDAITTAFDFHPGPIVDVAKQSAGKGKRIVQKKTYGKWPLHALDEPPLPPWPEEPLWVYRANQLAHNSPLPQPRAPAAFDTTDRASEHPQPAKSETSVSVRQRRSALPRRSRSRSRGTHGEMTADHSATDSQDAGTHFEPRGRRQSPRQPLEGNFQLGEPHSVRRKVKKWRHSVEESQDDLLTDTSDLRMHGHSTQELTAPSDSKQLFAAPELSSGVDPSVHSVVSVNSLAELFKHAGQVCVDNTDASGSAEQVPLPVSPAGSVGPIPSLGLGDEFGVGLIEGDFSHPQGTDVLNTFDNYTFLNSDGDVSEFGGAETVPLPLSVSSTSIDRLFSSPHAAADEHSRAADAGGSRIAMLGSNDTTTAGSRLGSVSGPMPNAREQRTGRPHPNYTMRITSLVHSMPHLKVLQTSDCRSVQSGLVTRLDYYGDINNPRRSKRKTFDHRYWLGASPRMRKKAFKHATDPRIYLRVLLVEDLSPALTEALGSAFNIDPEVFAEHLNRSGRNHMYNDALPSRWKTNKMPKSHYSLKWYRPVRQSPKVLSWLQSPGHREKLYSDGLRWSETSHESFGNDITEKHIHHCVSLQSNICRQSWPFSTRPLDGLSDTIAAAWEERATIYYAENVGATTLIVLLDPLPNFMDQIVLEEKAFVSGSFISRSKSSKASVDYDQKPVEAFMPMLPRTPVEFPPNKMSATLEQIQTLETVTTEASSTSADVESWIWRTSRSRITIPNITADPIMAILRLAQVDSITFLDSLEWTLDEINRDSLDDRLMTERLLAWRKLMSDLEIEVPAIARSLRGLVKPDHVSYSEALPMLDELDARVSSFMRRMAATHSSLRADMALLDSRQSIAEAQTVTKLTELAFAFIPLTFACSLFSMQITELQNGAPLWAFFVTAITLALLSYALRLLVQSGAISKSRRRAQQYALASGWKESAGTAPMRVVLQYLLKNGLKHARSSSGVVVFILALLPTILPIAFLWARNHLDPGLSAMLTVLVVPAGIVLAWCCAMGVTDSSMTIEDHSETRTTYLSTTQKLSLRVASLLPQLEDKLRSSSSSEV